MPYKDGGGNKPQLYDSKDGEYCRNPKCEEDEKNLVFIKLFGLETGTPIAYPEFNIHDKDYCNLVVKFCLNFNNPLIKDEKFTKYLLTSQAKNDKSKKLKDIGYDLSNYQELTNQVIKGTDFKKRKFKDFTKDKFTINTETKIWDKIRGKYYYCTTSWFVEKDFSLRFISLIPEVYKDE